MIKISNQDKFSFMRLAQKINFIGYLIFESNKNPLLIRKHNFLAVNLPNLHVLINSRNKKFFKKRQNLGKT